MNKFLILLNLVFFAVILFLLYNKKEKTFEKEKTIEKEKTAAIIKENYPCDPKICMDYSGTSFNYLEKRLLVAMSKNYDTTKIFTNFRGGHQVRNLAGNMVEDSRSIWFSLDSLKRFIWEIEVNICKNNCPKPQNLGIRLYYARYPDLNSYAQSRNLNPAYQNLHTIFMVPTYEGMNASNNKINIDFDPREFDSKNCRYKSLSGDGNGTTMAFAAGLDQTAQNHGTLCPPVCDGSAY